MSSCISVAVKIPIISPNVHKKGFFFSIKIVLFFCFFIIRSSHSFFIYLYCTVCVYTLKRVLSVWTILFLSSNELCLSVCGGKVFFLPCQVITTWVLLRDFCNVIVGVTSQWTVWLCFYLYYIVALSPFMPNSLHH